jgi:hypothetical protein
LVSASLSGREAPGYQLYEAQIEPALVRVTGPQDRLALIHGLEVPVRVDGLKNDAVRRVRVSLPEGLRFADANKGQVTIRLRVRTLRDSLPSTSDVLPDPPGSDTGAAVGARDREIRPTPSPGAPPLAGRLPPRLSPATP